MCAFSGLTSHWETGKPEGRSMKGEVEKWKHRAGGRRRLSWQEGSYLAQWAAKTGLRDTVGWRGYCVTQRRRSSTYPVGYSAKLKTWREPAMAKKVWVSGWRNFSCSGKSRLLSEGLLLLWEEVSGSTFSGHILVGRLWSGASPLRLAYKALDSLIVWGLVSRPWGPLMIQLKFCKVTLSMVRVTTKYTDLNEDFPILGCSVTLAVNLEHILHGCAWCLLLF